MRVVLPTSKTATDQAARVKLVVWHGGRKHVACLRTVRSAIENMIQGVRFGFQYKMRLVYAHFPINVNVLSEGTVVEIRNFLGEKVRLDHPGSRGVEARLLGDFGGARGITSWCWRLSGEIMVSKTTGAQDES